MDLVCIFRPAKEARAGTDTGGIRGTLFRIFHICQKKRMSFGHPFHHKLTKIYTNPEPKTLRD
jgi:hypothetical protein